MTEHFDPDWLALREGYDAESRSLALARRLLGVLPERPRLLDLGAGTGSLFRFLAPLIERPQIWVFADAASDLLGEAFRMTAKWAKARGWTVAWPGGALLVHTPKGVWRIEGLALDLADAPAGLPLAHTDVVLCSALLDLVSTSWLARFAAALHSPFFAGLSVDGRDEWLPRHPADAIVAAGFRRDQGRDKGFGRALGVHAPSVALRTLAARGFAVTSAPADWRVPGSALRMTRTLVRGTADAARAALPARHAAIAGWEAARTQQAIQGRLAIRIGHRDLLALEPAGSGSGQPATRSIVSGSIGSKPIDHEFVCGEPVTRSASAGRAQRPR
jgi:SAM-dependent methyltransferase